MFVTGSWGVSRTGVSVWASLTGCDVSSPGRSLLGRLGDEDEANQARFLGTNFFSVSSGLALIVGVGGSEIGKFVGTDSGHSSAGCDDGIAATVIGWEAG
jgi:hypothetical protein